MDGDRPADPRVNDVVRKFMKGIRERLGEKAIAVVAFGSRVWGGYQKDSDYDLMLIHRADPREVEEVVAEVALQLLVELGVGVEPIVVSLAEFLGEDKYFILKGKRNGLIFYFDCEEDIRRREAIDLLLLAEEFLEIAELLMKFKKYRGAIDEAYNAAELAIKALMLWDGYGISRSHGGLVGEFGRLYVFTGKVDRRVGRLLSLSLERRNRARYDARADLGEDEATMVIDTARKVIELVKQRIK